MTAIDRIRLLAAASLIALAAGSAQVHAQETATGEVDELIVTAQKREQRTIEVPIALTAYSGARLESLGIGDFADLSLFTPGFEVQNQSPNNPSFIMRGITSDSNDSSNEPRVSIFQDGVSISRGPGAYVELFDIERVEVAKGPQSTLYGRGALIGALNVVQAKASPAGFSVGGEVEIGDYNYRQLDGFVNVPVGESLAVRLAGRFKSRDGYVENLLGGEDYQSTESAAARLSLNWSPNDRFNLDVIYNYQQDEPSGTAFKAGTFSPTNPATGQVLGSRNPSDGGAMIAPNGFVGGPLGVERVVRGVTAIATYDINDAFTLTSVSAQRRFNTAESFDPDGISLPILTGVGIANAETFSQELRINYDAGGRVSWFAGANLFKENADSSAPLQIDERVALALVTGQLNASAAGSGLPATTPAPQAVFSNTAFTGALVQGLVAASSNGNVLLSNAQSQAIAANLRGNHQEDAETTTELTSVDLFGDVTFQATERLELSAGVRYTRDDKTTAFSSKTIGGRSVLGGIIGASGLAASGSGAGIAQANAILGALASPAVQSIPASALPNFGTTFQPTANNGDVTERDLEDSGFTWRLVGRYAATPDLNLYGSYARGRRPEVLAVGSPATPYATPRFTEVEAETVDSYEVGAKAQLLNNSLRVDGALFYYDYKNFQTTVQQGTLFITTNAGEAKSYGFEGAMDWSANESINLFATYAYNRSRFEGGAFDGNSFRLSPDHSASIGASLRLAALGGTFDFRPTYTWQSKVFFDNNNDLPQFQTLASGAFVADTVQDEVQDAYGLVNLRLSYRPDTAPVTIEAFVTNAADEEYIIDAGNTGDSLGLPTFIAGAPRFYGVSVAWRY